jgi:hypothetical protein
MSLKRWSARRDDNEAPIVSVLQQCGALVCPLSIAGMPDLLVCHRGRLLLLEVKRPRRALNDAQQRQAALGWPVTVVRSVSEALAVLGMTVTL